MFLGSGVSKICRGVGILPWCHRYNDFVVGGPNASVELVCGESGFAIVSKLWTCGS